ncbi:MAG: phosphatase PAP2-related protein [Candidatus Nanoarchaeia archaeon]|nr:phosphatase PAP2-related protein [Candidatus Nanoarchaeia archaeon]
MYTWKEWKKEVWHHKHLILLSLLFLLISFILNYFASIYVSEISSVAAPDLILDHLPTFDLDFILTYGILLIIALIFLYPLLFKVHYFHTVVSQFSLLVLVRSIFICFTHLKIPVNALTFKAPHIISFFSAQNDLFFSGHTAIPFLGFLLFHEEKIGYFFLLSSFIMGIVVLLMHVHYSIDVFSAFFITYGTFKFGKWVFGKIHK